MDWSKEAASKLKEYEAKRAALEGIPLEIQELEQSFARIRSASADSTPIKGPSKRDDAILNNVVSREELTQSYHCTKQWMDRVDKALAVMSPEERMILERFYIHPEPKAADRLAGDLHVDDKTVYRRKNAALRKFTIALYGVTET